MRAARRSRSREMLLPNTSVPSSGHAVCAQLIGLAVDKVKCVFLCLYLTLLCHGRRRVDVCISSSHLARVMTPSVTMEVRARHATTRS